MKLWHRIFTTFAIVIVLAATILLAWYNYVLRIQYNLSQPTIFTVTQGSSSREIVDKLAAQGLVQYPTATLLYVHQHGVVFLAGDFTIPQSYTLSDLMQILSKEQKSSTKLVIPEGWNRQQIADEIGTHNLSASTFLSLSRASEGMLFPDTYDIDKNTTEKDIFTRMTDQYTKEIGTMQVTAQELTLASIVEREGKNDTDRPIIAAVYANRLKIGMALEADPTVQYAKYTDLGLAPLENGKRNYWAPITKADYANVISPFNTYKVNGLPPHPICNPGLKSIIAVKNPAKISALYFFHTASGQIITSNTLDEHNRNKAIYLK